MSRRALPSVLLLAVLAACSGGSGSDGGAVGTPTASLPADQRGTPAPEALSDVSCAAGEDGTWSATGLVVNRTDAGLDFRVIAYVGPADGQARAASVTTVEGVGPDESSRFELTGIPPHGESPVCHLQVLTLD